MMEKRERRKGLAIMAAMITLVKPLLPLMLVAVILGTVGFLCAIFLTILAGAVLMPSLQLSPELVFLTMGILAVLRGILHYGEQYCNHYIAFKLLAIIRHRVFSALRKLCPAKLEGKDKGKLIAIITTDIELLEVFYAHTISPIIIALVTSAIMVIFMGHYHWTAGLLAALFYTLVGMVVPVINGHRGGAIGMRFRQSYGALNTQVLDTLRGLDEIVQYGQGEARLSLLAQESRGLGKLQGRLSAHEGSQRAVTNTLVLLATLSMVGLTLTLYSQGQLDPSGVLLCTVAMMGSFGPVVALSNLSNNLNQTLAAGERVLSLLEEKPVVAEVGGSFMRGLSHGFTGATAKDITFGYGEETILSGYSMDIVPGQIIGIHGASGSGKSTFLKLLMRFWDIDSGELKLSGEDVAIIPTKKLRETEAYVTQETQLFHDSIFNNIALGWPGATLEMVKAAAQKAAIAPFIEGLKEGYDTPVGELGDTLSGGEKQRIGLARAFLHDAPLLLLDEPTSNLDSLNEAIILKALREACQDKTVVLVSHRKSTMGVAKRVYFMENGRAGRT